MSTAKLQETQKTLSKSVGQYDELLNDKISEDQLDAAALNIAEIDLKQTMAPQPVTVRLFLNYLHFNDGVKFNLKHRYTLCTI
jgi:hypothetical protein